MMGWQEETSGRSTKGEEEGETAVAGEGNAHRQEDSGWVDIKGWWGKWKRELLEGCKAKG